MTWSREEALRSRKDALRLLLDHQDRRYCRSLDWFPQAKTDVPLAVWTLLYDEGLIDWYAPGGNRFRLTVSGWIEACSLLRDEIDLDRRFGVLSAHLKNLTSDRTELFAEASTQAIADEIQLPVLWVSDAIAGQMAEVIYHQDGARLVDPMGGVEIPTHVGKCLLRRNSTVCSQGAKMPRSPQNHIL